MIFSIRPDLKIYIDHFCLPLINPCLHIPLSDGRIRIKISLGLKAEPL